jgi:hypothetical protein
MVSIRHTQVTSYDEPSLGSLDISLATLARQLVPSAARYQICRPGISHSSQRVPQLANAVAIPVKCILNFWR